MDDLFISVLSEDLIATNCKLLTERYRRFEALILLARFIKYKIKINFQAFQVQAIDSVYIDLKDSEGLRKYSEQGERD